MVLVNRLDLMFKLDTEGNLAISAIVDIKFRRNKLTKRLTPKLGRDNDDQGRRFLRQFTECVLLQGRILRQVIRPI